MLPVVASIVLVFFAPITVFLPVYGGVTRFCEICKCSYDTVGDPDVTCTDNPQVINYLYEEDFWRDVTQNDTSIYGIHQLTVQNIELPILERQFPVSNLKKLDLSFNIIAKINHSNLVFANLQEMEELDLSHNELTILDGEMFRGLRVDSRDYPLRSVRVFRVSHNILHTLDQDLFEHLDGVEVLDISHNPFDVIDQQTEIAITSLPYLKELDLENTGIGQLPDYILHTPKFLKVLDLSGNQFTGIPKPLQEAKSLEVLYFNQNPIVNLTEDNGFPLIESLTTLHLCHIPQLQYIGKNALNGLTQLKELHISNNVNLKEIDGYALTRREDGAENEIWPPISKLDIRNNKLSYLDRHFIVKWEGLTDLDLTENPWSCDCENQWMLDVLLPAYVGINLTEAKELICASPREMQGKFLYDLYQNESNMRCLDYYGNHPEDDAVMLVGILAGLLIGIPVVLFLIYAYQRRCFSLFDNSPAAYSRQFYTRTRSGDDFY